MREYQPGHVSETLKPTLVRVFAVDGFPIGAGFVIGEQRILTCAHVVAEALDISQDDLKKRLLEENIVTIQVDLPFLRQEQKIEARVDTFNPKHDIATLAVLTTLPVGAKPVRLITIDSAAQIIDHPIWVYGFPEGVDEGVFAQGEIVQETAAHLLQIVSNSSIDYAVVPGFSGGPVLDASLQGVVGMVKAAEKDRAIKTAFAIPTDVLLSNVPNLPTAVGEYPDILAYFSQLEAEAEEKNAPFYTDLSGQHRQRVAAPQTFRLRRKSPLAAHFAMAESQMAEPQTFEDAVTQLQVIRRAVLLGDPGSGKTTTLYKLAYDLLTAARLAPGREIPVTVPLGYWRDAEESLLDFMRRSSGTLSEHFDRLLVRNRLAFLLDGLNEMPTRLRRDKLAQIQTFAREHQGVMLIASCRVEDYKELALPLDEVEVAPLHPLQIKGYVENYLGEALGEALFWQLAGEDSQALWQQFEQVLGEKLAAPERTFWLEQRLPEGLDWRWVPVKNRYYHWETWVSLRDNPAGLLTLARNPYLLYMLGYIYEHNQMRLPQNKGELFHLFVLDLLAREGLVADNDLPNDEGQALYEALTDLAWEMQTERPLTGEDKGVLTTLPLDEAARYLDGRQQYLAASANLLTIDAEVRFSHQLLQEYFVARGLDRRIWQAADTPLQPTSIWPPDRWWQSTNWEEAVILLAGFYSDDCTPVLKWLAAAQPELAARCLVESGAIAPPESILELRDRWLPRLTDIHNEPNAQARAAVGRALGRITLEDGALLDNRPGVGFTRKGKQKIPDIRWSETVRAGKYYIGGDKSAYQSLEKQKIEIPQDFQLSIYPITYVQFQCFIEAQESKGYDPYIWQDIPVEERRWSSQWFPFWNHPREWVSWYQAVAFCRWLTEEVGYEIRLPREDEWEVAARSPDNRYYPYGNHFDASKNNTGLENRRIDQTSPVGIYPHGRNPAINLYDMSGNVWEWCLNSNDDLHDTSVSRAPRVVRGGSWYYGQSSARVASRNFNLPDNRDYNYGFRVVRRPPSQTH